MATTKFNKIAYGSADEWFRRFEVPLSYGLG